MSVMPALMPGSSQMQIGTTAKSTGINMSRDTVLSTSHSRLRTASSLTYFHPPSVALNPPPKPAESCSTSMPPPSTNSIYQSTTNSTASSSHNSAGSCPPAYSGSDDEHHRHQLLQTTTDERKQRRMLSNRESARRSRMRKEQHLDDLRAQIVQLRAENNHILDKFNVASQQYMQMEDENRALRSYAMDLSREVQALGIALQQAGYGLHSIGFDSQFTESIPMPEMDVNLFSQK
ncbi:hypothetical protein SUGI_0979160 [Cryptomeria japonica]|uniref:bZIP transcription factor 2 n=1 Tax=Cryptomeria japonica TaxID=3369 RepID=UPI0024147753|nr:bZIP transcription factor 2 [Cryptomeria japonica]GLJ46459.1 hypothetical protein SUGI_0979160 [Cryptomeria japonica]